MLNYKIKIGMVPVIRDLFDFSTRKGIFEPAKGAENKNRVRSYIQEHFRDDMTDFCDLEWLNELGVLYKNEDVDRVCAYLQKEKVDAIFLINCNFGNEEACGRLAKKLKLPVLLWGAQDMVFEENGQRYTDVQCGLFAISKQLRRYQIPFSYIENSPVESEVFAKGLQRFFSVVTMVKNFKNLTVTQVGTRLTPFKSVMYNELELTEKFGINMNNLNMAVFEQKFRHAMEEKKGMLQEEAKEIKKRYDVDGVEDALLEKMLAFVYAYQKVFEETGSDVLASECWTAMPAAVGANPCLAMSVLYDMGYIVTCESDIHGAITNALLMCAARGKSAPAFGELTVRHPENPNAELLWHCGPFPYSMKDEKAKAKLFNTKPSFKAKDGQYTIARFQGDRGKYTLLGGEFKTVPGPHTFGTYMWAEFKDWPKIEKKMIYGPYIHHMSEIYGSYADVLEEFCQFIPGLQYDPIEE
ncbi:L-fucose/L-arabinose isomerase family protein [Ructibacterium gallinarum]|uniref:Fucose isomerase n=1 Tax=Ructibacterium gallinarum TaxID=2779355 RepID=A0A9D5RC75_9FIRM|nr:fucose isomerase [Ructibacterium gallinarum]MBE5040738.1 fucose isomerase [Ructibacterium gallinarum]